MSEARIFPARGLVAVITVAAVAFVGVLFFMGRSDKGGSPTDAAGPGVYSRSAIGYAGIARLLEEAGVPVAKSRFDALEKLGSGSVLVIAEPRLSDASEPTMRRLLTAPTVLLVLPKWTGEPSGTRPGWLASAELRPVDQAERVLRLATEKGQVSRMSGSGDWSLNQLGPAPAPVEPMQLAHDEELRPIVGGRNGILVGELARGQQRLWVLSDPDVIANHGLSKGGNVALAFAIFNALRGSGGSIVFDEAVHGYAFDAANPLSVLFRAPFVFVVIQAAFAAILLLWAAMTRFGAPEALPPALAAGRQGLLRNAAGLLEFAGRQQIIVERYVQATIRYAASQLRAPRGLADDALLAWLQRIGRARAVTLDCAEIVRRSRQLLSERRPDRRALSQAARDVHRWKGEILDGR